MKQAEQLQRGLAKLGPRFFAELCPVCEGAGEYRQSYTVGCGGGDYEAMGKCDWCLPSYPGSWARSLGHGLRVGQHPAASSVFNQVMEAGK